MASLPQRLLGGPQLGQEINSYRKTPLAWWPKIAQEYAAGMSGPKLAKKSGVESTQTIYLNLEKCCRNQQWIVETMEQE